MQTHDITDAELKAIQDQQVEAEIEQSGCPTDDQLLQEIENMNVSSTQTIAGATS